MLVSLFLLLLNIKITPHSSSLIRFAFKPFGLLSYTKITARLVTNSLLPQSLLFINVLSPPLLRPIKPSSLFAFYLLIIPISRSLITAFAVSLIETARALPPFSFKANIKIIIEPGVRGSQEGSSRAWTKMLIVSVR